MLGDSNTIPILSSAVALLFGLLWASGVFGRVRSPKPKNEVSRLNHSKPPPIEATAANGKDVWEVPRNLGELTISKLLVHPIKVSL